MHRHIALQANNILKDAVVVTLRNKNVPIHQGHIDLITHAKNMGRVVVLIQSYFNELSSFLIYGNTRCSLNGQMTDYRNLPVEDLSQEISSIEHLGVEVIQRGIIKELGEEERLNRIQECKEFVDPYREQLGGKGLYDLALLSYFAYQQRRDKKEGEINFLPKAYLSGPEVLYFFAREAYKNMSRMGKSYSSLLHIRPSFTKHSCGLKLGTNLLQTDEEDKEEIVSLKDSLSTLEKGDNKDLIKEVNFRRQPNKRKWSVLLAHRHSGGIFGKSILDNFAFVSSTGLVVDDADFMEKSKSKEDQE